MTKQPARIQVRETTLVDRYSFEGKLEEIIEMLQDWKNEGEWEGIVIDYYDDETSYQLYKHRPETDKEYDKRMKEIEKQKAEKLKAKERRRKEYEKLKKEFEDT
jgi:23S rRNA G2069 N7-methylase RlmK/C1962 C5-methylase RlmI